MNICLLADARSIHTRRLATGLSRLGARVHVVTHKPASIDGATVERFRVPPASPLNLRRWESRRRKRLLDLIRAHDVVNVQFLGDWGLDDGHFDAGCVVATAWGSDIVPPPGEDAPDGSVVASRRALLRGAAAVTACGPTFAGVVADFAGLPRERVDVAPFGVNTRLFRRDRTMSPNDRGGLRVGFFKGFRAVYDPVTLLRAVPLVRSRIPDVSFELVGDGQRKAECQCLAREIGVDDAITWSPAVPHETLPARIARWDISVIPSIHEAFGVAALESSSMETPVVASNVCGLRDTVRNGDTGVLVPPGDPAAFAEAIVELLSNPSKRTRMGRAGREWVCGAFEASDVHRRWLALFDRARNRAVVMA